MSSTVPPEFESHLPELVNNYLNAHENMGPGALCISFTAETGNCDCYYMTLDRGPPEMNKAYHELKESCNEDTDRPVILIFHDSDKTFVEGQPHCFKVKFEEKGNDEPSQNSQSAA